MTNNIGWTQWSGKRSAPVFTAGHWVSIQFRDGHEVCTLEPWNWDWLEQSDETRDIVAYKV